MSRAFRSYDCRPGERVHFQWLFRTLWDLGYCEYIPQRYQSLVGSSLTNVPHPLPNPNARIPSPPEQSLLTTRLLQLLLRQHRLHLRHNPEPRSRQRIPQPPRRQNRHPCPRQEHHSVQRYCADAATHRTSYSGSLRGFAEDPGEDQGAYLERGLGFPAAAYGDGGGGAENGLVS